MLDCRIAESLLKPLSEPPILSIVVPTFNRTPEMITTVESLASQVVDGLESKVEILISDNASEPAGQAAIRALAGKYACVSYMLNATDQGGYFQLFSACWRSRGQWTWTFGSDDLLLPGGVAHIVGLLEREAPSFLTQNKRIGNQDLSEEMVSSVNGIPDRRFANFVELFCGVGFHQIAFMSSSIERTDAARKIDPTPYLEASTLHPHLLSYFEKHHDQPCYYTAANYLVHRTHNAQLSDYMPRNFKDVSRILPILIMQSAQKYGVPPDFFDQINGSRKIDNYDKPKITFVDNMFEYMMRGIAGEKFVHLNEKYALDNILKHCRPGRLETFSTIWGINEEMRRKSHDLTARRKILDAEWAEHQAQLKTISDESIIYTDKSQMHI
jgi:glycosyltransferase involved in cell wall biosynthesis